MLASGLCTRRDARCVQDGVGDVQGPVLRETRRHMKKRGEGCRGGHDDGARRMRRRRVKMRMRTGGGMGDRERPAGGSPFETAADPMAAAPSAGVGPSRRAPGGRAAGCTVRGPEHRCRQIAGLTGWLQSSPNRSRRACVGTRMADERPPTWRAAARSSLDCWGWGWRCIVGPPRSPAVAPPPRIDIG